MSAPRAPRAATAKDDARHGIRLLDRKRAYRGRVITLLRDTIEINGRRLVREIVEHPGSVVIVPVLPRKRILFIRQYRRALGATLLELPAGTLGAGEPRLRCAKRELEEETGHRARRWRRLGDFYPSPGFLSEFMTIFLAEDLAATAARPEADELLEPVVLPLDVAIRKIHAGGIRDAKSIIGIWLASDRIKARRL